MTHILAWTLEAFACSEDLRQSVLDLEPAEADQVIWTHAWQGEDFQARFAQAVHTFASELATFILDVTDLQNSPVEWTEALLGLRNSSYYLEIASEAKRNDSHVLNWVTTQYAGMAESAALAVAETLREGLWREFTDEHDRRRFVFQEARRKDQEFDLTVLDCAGISGLPQYRVDHWERCGLLALAAGRDSIVVSMSDFATPLVMDTGGFRERETLLSFKEAITASGLTLNAQRVMYAKMRDYTREEAHTPLGITERQVAAGWRELNRKKDIFLKILSPNPRPNSTLQ